MQCNAWTVRAGARPVATVGRAYPKIDSTRYSYYYNFISTILPKHPIALFPNDPTNIPSLYFLTISLLHPIAKPYRLPISMQSLLNLGLTIVPHARHPPPLLFLWLVFQS